MHLSAPEGISINDYIDKEDFPIHYATVDDAVAMVTEYGKECIQAKIDLKAAFRMVPRSAPYILKRFLITFWEDTARHSNKRHGASIKRQSPAPCYNYM